MSELIASRKRLAKSPRGRNNIDESESVGINQSELKREDLVPKVSVALPVDTPVPSHGHPFLSPGGPHPRRLHVAASADVGDHHHVEAALPSQCESDSSSPMA